MFPPTRMNAFCLILAALSQLLLVKCTQYPDEGPLVLCYYVGLPNTRGEVLEPEDVDVTLCTHLVYYNGKISSETGEVVPRSPEYAYYENDGKGHYDRIRKLKEINPKLKVLLHVDGCCEAKIPRKSSGRSTYISSAVAILQTHGFDGLQVDWVSPEEEEESLPETYFALLLNDLRAEFDKHGFLLTTYLPVDESVSVSDRNLRAITRTSDFVTVRTFYYWGPWDGVTGLFSSLTSIKSSIDIYLSKNVPAEKMLILIATMGMAAQLTNINETLLGAEAGLPVIETDFGTSYCISYGELSKRFRNQTENWVIRRDEATKSPYASNKDGLWISYDDSTSVASKCRYVIEHNLRGATVMALDLDDYSENGGEGTFPLTRVAYNTLTKRRETD